MEHLARISDNHQEDGTSNPFNTMNLIDLTQLHQPHALDQISQAILAGLWTRFRPYYYRVQEVFDKQFITIQQLKPISDLLTLRLETVVLDQYITVYRGIGGVRKRVIDLALPDSINSLFSCVAEWIPEPNGSQPPHRQIARYASESRHFCYDIMLGEAWFYNSHVSPAINFPGLFQ